MGVGGDDVFTPKICFLKKDPTLVRVDYIQHVRRADENFDDNCLWLGDTAVYTENEVTMLPMPFKAKTLELKTTSLPEKLNGNSEIWVGIGFHSGFEGMSQIFYKNIEVLME